MKDEHQDLTDLFLSLQQELLAAGIGRATSLEAQLRAVELDLRGYFRNRTHLGASLGTGGLTYEHAFLKRTHAWSTPVLSTLLQEYRDASDVDDRRLYESLTASQGPVLRAHNNLVSVAHLEGMVARSKPLVFARSCFRNIGDIIEACLFPFLRIRLHVLRIATCTSDQDPDVADLSLGRTIDELTRIDAKLYAPPPFAVRLSQWRNIAAHSGYHVRGEKIHCQYGNGRRFECTPAQLLDVARYANDVYYVHKVAHEIFCIDNIERAFGTGCGSGEGREARNPDLDFEFNTDVILTYSVVASGFRIRNARRTGLRWTLHLEDAHGRSKPEVQRTLQAALLSYMVHVKSVHLHASVRSRGASHSLSFRGELRNSETKLQAGEHSTYAVGRNFRVDESSRD